MKPVNHMPRIYDVHGEKLHLRLWDPVAEKDIWYPISYGELRNVVEDGLAALMRQMRELEAQRRGGRG